ncbi:hypothetical protein [uncultured Paraglaciecola sp.]|uniref:hypothetical protein n=1 Tax=uncultured Paraglaciecola sp. TaxID=1765024 RepID=UPI002624BC00|nr:hypothetical protein [uncultured Paraglaciecola sp.]
MTDKGEFFTIQFNKPKKCAQCGVEITSGNVYLGGGYLGVNHPFLCSECDDRMMKRDLRNEAPPYINKTMKREEC